VEQPAGRAPAPAPLDRIQDFVNTVDRLDGLDETFTDPQTAGTWLCDHGYGNGADRLDLTPKQLAELIEVREAIRALCLHNADPAIDIADAVEVLDAAARRGRLVVSFADHGELRSRARGVDAVTGTLLSIIQAALVDSTWRRLKACLDCGWVFHDGSRSRAGRWCTMTVCGNRAKGREHRRRQAARGQS
jgi:predicted RNA-binding Zn ribbon-like protein